MGFASLDSPQVADLVRRFAGARAVTLIVGAGASMESSLPSWRVLVERLLSRVAADSKTLTEERWRKDWIERTLEREDLLAAAAVVEVMAGSALGDMLLDALYGKEGAGSFQPGPTAHQVAYLRRCFGDRLTLLTTNYDDLIERALLSAGYSKRDVRSHVRRRKVSRAAFAVTHLHGFAGPKGPPRSLVLTEEQYQRMQRHRSWQERCVIEQLEGTHCLFVGTSLTDPNLIRYLYGYPQTGSRGHAAIFVRQGEGGGGDWPEVRRAREDAVAKRWARRGVEAVFVDHFADAAQLLYEIGHARGRGTDYRPVGERAAAALSAIEDVVLLANAPEAEFADRQVQLSKWLRSTLKATLATVPTKTPRGEPLALTLWLLDRDGRKMTGWVHSDRAHQDPSTLDSVPVRADTPWVGVRAMCQGVQVQQDRFNEESRWRFVRALPITLDEPSRLPIGCLTIASGRSEAKSVLTKMPNESQRAFHEALLAAVTPALVDVAGTASAK